MSGTAIKFRMNSSYQGEITRSQQMLIEPFIINDVAPGIPVEFGIPIVMDAVSKKGRAMLAGDTVPQIIGFLMRDYPSNSVSNDPLNTSTPLVRPGAAMSLIKAGYMAVKVEIGTPVAGAPVYIRVTDVGPSFVGAVEATADGVNTVALPRTTFTGTMDARGIAEIRYNIP